MFKKRSVYGIAEVLFQLNDSNPPLRWMKSLLINYLEHDDLVPVQVKREEHIWDAAFATGISLPALCHQGY